MQVPITFFQLLDSFIFGSVRQIVAQDKLQANGEYTRLDNVNFFTHDFRKFIALRLNKALQVNVWHEGVDKG